MIYTTALTSKCSVNSIMSTFYVILFACSQHKELYQESKTSYDVEKIQVKS